MNRNRFSLLNIYIIIAGLMLIMQMDLFSETTIIRYDESSESLENRWAWSLEKIKEYDACWIGYSFEQLMESNSWMGSRSDGSENRSTLGMLIEGMQGSNEDAALSAQRGYY